MEPVRDRVFHTKQVTNFKGRENQFDIQVQGLGYQILILLIECKLASEERLESWYCKPKPFTKVNNEEPRLKPSALQSLSGGQFRLIINAVNNTKLSC